MSGWEDAGCHVARGGRRVPPSPRVERGSARLLLQRRQEQQRQRRRCRSRAHLKTIAPCTLMRRVTYPPMKQTSSPSMTAPSMNVRSFDEQWTHSSGFSSDGVYHPPSSPNTWSVRARLQQARRPARWRVHRPCDRRLGGVRASHLAALWRESDALAPCPEAVREEARVRSLDVLERVVGQAELAQLTRATHHAAERRDG